MSIPQEVRECEDDSNTSILLEMMDHDVRNILPLEDHILNNAINTNDDNKQYLVKFLHVLIIECLQIKVLNANQHKCKRM